MHLLYDPRRIFDTGLNPGESGNPRHLPLTPICTILLAKKPPHLARRSGRASDGKRAIPSVEIFISTFSVRIGSRKFLRLVH